MSVDDVFKLTNDMEISKKVMIVADDVRRYHWFNQAKALGVVYSPRDLPFTDLVLFSWIRGISNNV